MSDRLNPRNSAVAWSFQLEDRLKLFRGLANVGALEEALAQLELIHRDTHLAKTAIENEIRSKVEKQNLLGDRKSKASPGLLERLRFPERFKAKPLASGRKN